MASGLHIPLNISLSDEGAQAKDSKVGSVSRVSPPDDKPMLARLLRLAVAGAFSRGPGRDEARPYEANEELSRLIPILCHVFTHAALAELVGDKVVSQMIDLRRDTVLQNLLLEAELQAALRALGEAGIELLLFKGAAVAHTIYADASLRTYHDFDLLIHPDDLQRADQVLSAIGYRAYDEYRVDAIDEQRTGYNYRLKRPEMPLAVLLELHTSLHASEIGSLFDLDALWSRAIPITVLGESVATMHPVDHFLYLCWHYRFHAFSRLIWLYDLVMLLRTYGDDFDWSSLVGRARSQQMRATLYYCLSWCQRLFAVEVPASVFASLRPPLLASLIVERMAMPDVAKALAQEKAYDRRLLARRAMVDSHATMMKAFLRTVFPSKLAISKRYMQHSRLPLQLYFLFYLIHPWVALAKGCRSLLTNLTKRER